MTEAHLILSGVSRTYRRGKERIDVLRDVDLEMQKGEYLALMGPSGSGKSTLLNLIAGLDKPSGGTITIGLDRLDRMSDAELTHWRARHTGYVFQSYNLLPALTARQNVEFPLSATGVRGNERRKRADLALEIVGLSDRRSHYPKELSGGQQQRVGIARAIVTDPDLLLADEPTGDLDRQAADGILDLFEALNHEHCKTVVMVTHDPLAASRATVQKTLDKGNLSPAA